MLTVAALCEGKKRYKLMVREREKDKHIHVHVYAFKRDTQVENEHEIKQIKLKSKKNESSVTNRFAQTKRQEISEFFFVSSFRTQTYANCVRMHINQLQMKPDQTGK